MELNKIKEIDNLIRKQIDCSLNLYSTPELGLLCNAENLISQLIFRIENPKEAIEEDIKFKKLME